MAETVSFLITASLSLLLGPAPTRRPMELQVLTLSHRRPRHIRTIRLPLYLRGGACGAGGGV